MKRFVFVLIGIMMTGGMAAAEATGNESATQATVPVGSTIVMPVSEVSKEVVFDVEGVEIIAQAELDAVEGARQIRNDPNEGPYTEKEMQKERDLDREWKRERAEGLVTQADLGERAVANWNQACKFLTLVSGPQLDSGRIWSDTKTIEVINYMMGKGWIREDFYVNNPNAIVNYAAKECGFSTGDVTFKNNGKITPRYLEMVGITALKGDHTNLCNLEGKFIWDPYYGGEDRIIRRTNQRFIRFE
ncbi:exported hypothetical protein [uncultured spirochete]|jgi:hypothetical protein|uniref:Uncharacterized protein n=1 Tax=uncultured spirochete TaxID=156406 RepID=A0A3P3XP16_9SPIR|nr:exported hypothetical protein [uncultured spirochete]